MAEPEPNFPKTESRAQPPAAVGLLAVGATIELRKPHACGGSTWKLERLGAQVGLLCLTCRHRVQLARADFQRRLRRVCPASPPEPDETASE
jgi:hypothetical protein